MVLFVSQLGSTGPVGPPGATGIPGMDGIRGEMMTYFDSTYPFIETKHVF